MSNSTVRSAPMKPPRSRVDPPILLAKVGVGLAVLSFGGLVWAINGGFSVIGLGVIAGEFNYAGRLFWATATALTVPVPVTVPGLPTTIPVIPWGIVLASSCVQIAVVWLKLSGHPVPHWLY